MDVDLIVGFLTLNLKFFEDYKCIRTTCFFDVFLFLSTMDFYPLFEMRFTIISAL